MTGTDINQIILAVQETLYMSFASLIFATFFGLIIGILLYVTQKDGLYPNMFINRILDITVNIFRAIPFIILLFLLFPVTKKLVGSILGATAAIPALSITAIAFYSRMCVIALKEVDRGTIEASKAMGASKWQIVYKVLLPEASPAIVSGIALTGINLIGYTAMAGAIGSGGLGNIAYLYGFVRQNMGVLWTCTITIVVIVFIIQFVGDYVSHKIDKR